MFEAKTNETIKNLRLILQTMNSKNDEIEQEISLYTEEIYNLQEEDGLIYERINDCKRKFVEVYF